MNDQDEHCSPITNFSVAPVSPFKLTTVLSRAITYQAPRRTRLLLRRGCDPNLAVGHRQLRPLMVACFIADRRRRTIILKMLLKYGADPTLTDLHGRNSGMYLCAMSLVDGVTMMIKDCDLNLNATDMYGDTLLHFCAKAGSNEVLGVVLREMQKYRMNISIQNSSYLTPLSVAILNGHYDCARRLHEAGGSPRFTEAGFSHIVLLLCKHHKILSSVGVRAINDAKSVGRAFDAKRYFLRSARILKDRAQLPRGTDGKGNSSSFLPKIEVEEKGFLSICPLPPSRESCSNIDL